MWRQQMNAILIVSSETERNIQFVIRYFNLLNWKVFFNL